MAWVFRYPELVTALAATPQRRLSLEIDWHDGRPPMIQEVSRPLAMTDRDGTPWEFTALLAGSRVRIVRQGQTRILDLPFREEIVEGRVLSARTVLTANLAAARRPKIRKAQTADMSLDRGGKVVLGRGQVPDPTLASGDCRTSPTTDSRNEIPDPSLAPDHCLFIQDSARNLWVIDNGTSAGTFVNGEPIVAARLQDGDVLQLGQYGWNYDADWRRLIPLPPIKGARLCARGLAVASRIDEFNLVVKPGEFVAVVGDSGAGKSTLLHALLAGPSTPIVGSISLSGNDAYLEPQLFRKCLGFVSQQAALHGDLPAIEAARFSASMRGRTVDKLILTKWLRRLDLQERDWEKPVGDLSGGEQKRVRVAAELVRVPSCLLLDEPASGLDGKRERRLMRILRTISFQGCTVLIVTHSDQLHWVDRVLVVKKMGAAVRGTLSFDGTPAAYRLWKARNDQGDDARSTTAESQASETAPQTTLRCTFWRSWNACRYWIGAGLTQTTLRRTFWRSWSIGQQAVIEFGHLFRRELVRLMRAWVARIVVPLVIVPTIFALLIHLSVQGTDRDLLGFLAVLSCLWMGGSLSLTSIVEEREVIDYERLLFLRLGPYLAAKCLLFWILATAQTLVFLIILQGLRWFESDGDHRELYGAVPWVALTLCLASSAAVGLGLFLSALAKAVGSKELRISCFPWS